MNLDSVSIPGRHYVPPPTSAPVVVPAVLTNASVRLTLTGDSNYTYELQASTNLSNWTTLLTTNSPAPPLNWTDTNAGNFLRRFYRVLLGP